MKPAEYFEAAKRRLNIESDYALCKRLGVPDKSMPAMKTGTRAVPLDVAFKLAITLELDPAAVVADLEAQREKNPARQDFWRSFMARAAMLVAALACTLALNSFATCGAEAGRLGGTNRRWRFV